MPKQKYNVRPVIKEGIVIDGKVCDHISVAAKSHQYMLNLILQGKMEAYKLERGYYIPRGVNPDVRKYVKHGDKMNKINNE